MKTIPLCTDPEKRLAGSLFDFTWIDENGAVIPKKEIGTYLARKQHEANMDAMKKYMPIGTVIGLQDDFAGPYYMIIGYNQTRETAAYDYICCPYPEGLPCKIKFFNHAQIGRIYHLGYIHPMGKAYRDSLLKGEK